MIKEDKTKEQLMPEMGQLRQRIIELENFELERKQLEAALREKEHYYRSLLANLHEDILVIDRDHRITDVNNSFLVATGRKREETIGRRCFEVSHGYGEPCDRHGVECKLREVLETGSPRNYVHKHVRDDCSEAWVEISLSPLKDSQGNVTQVIEVARNVTAQIVAEETLWDSEYQYLTLVHNLPGVVYRGFRDWSIQFIDEKVELLTGYSAVEFNSKRI